MNTEELQVGDWVEIVGYKHQDLTVGKQYQIINIFLDCDHIVIVDDVNDNHVINNEFIKKVLLEEELKVGDWVVNVSDTGEGFGGLTIGKSYQLNEHKDNRYYYFKDDLERPRQRPKNLYHILESAAVEEVPVNRVVTRLIHFKRL